MKYRKQDANGDYVLGTGNDFLINSPAAVAQAVETRLQLYAGEWFLDTSEGTPWRTDILGRYPLSNYTTILKDRILGTAGVSEITSFSSSFDSKTRTLSISVELDTIYGKTTLDTTL